MKQVTTIGLDLAKAVFQVHGVDASGVVRLRRAVRRRQVLSFVAKLPPCLVGMAVALRSLAVAVQAVPRLVEQVADQGAADPRDPALAAPAPGGARSCRSTATAIPDPPASSVRPTPRDPRPMSGP